MEKIKCIRDKGGSLIPIDKITFISEDCWVSTGNDRRDISGSTLEYLLTVFDNKQESFIPDMVDGHWPEMLDMQHQDTDGIESAIADIISESKRHTCSPEEFLKTSANRLIPIAVKTVMEKVDTLSMLDDYTYSDEQVKTDAQSEAYYQGMSDVIKEIRKRI